METRIKEEEEEEEEEKRGREGGRSGDVFDTLPSRKESQVENSE